MSKDVGLWGKFSSAEETLLILAKNGTSDAYKRLSAGTLPLLKKSQKVYFPSNRRILAGKAIDDQIAELVRLPYPVTTILTDTELPVSDEVRRIYKGPKTKFDSHSVIIAFDPTEITDIGGYTIYPQKENSIGFICILEIPEEVREHYLKWALVPTVFFAYRSENGYTIEGEALEDKNSEAFSQEGLFNFDVILNTCAVLNLQNVSAETHTAPAALNKARIKKGKAGLYDYKILVVDGERWDGRHSTSHSNHDGVRSHFRRGHIRRLETGKAVWVRSTIVQGSREGFVEKTYSLESKNAVHQVPSSV